MPVGWWRGSRPSWVLEMVRRLRASGSLVLLPRRWVVERTFGWLGRHRRLSKDYAALPKTSAAWIRIVMVHLMLRRLNPA